MLGSEHMEGWVPGELGAGTTVWGGGCRKQAEHLGGAETKLEARGQLGRAPVPGRTSEPHTSTTRGGCGVAVVSSPAVAVMAGPRERGRQFQTPWGRK